MVARVVVPVGAVALIWLIVLTMVVVTGAPVVAAAGAFDLTCTAGLAMWLLGVRPGHLPKRALTVTVALGVVAARVLLARVGHASHVVFAAAVTLELSAIIALVVRLRRGTSNLGLLGRVLATELTIVRFAFAGWRRPSGDWFTVHRTNGWGLYAGTFVALTLVETPLVHVALSAFGHATAAWVLTALSLYSVVWLVGDLHALRHGGVALRGEWLELRVGVRWRAQIARADIVWAARCDGATCKTTDFSILGANVVLRLAAPHEVRGLFGRRRVVRELALSVDDADEFLAALRSDALAIAHDGA